MKNVLATLMVFLLFFTVNAQSVEMADTMRSEGKIYVVVGVVALIFVVLFLYLVSIDRKLRKLEKEIKK